MKYIPKSHQLMILSKDSELYKQLIEQAGLSGLSIVAVSDPNEAIRLRVGSDLFYGKPSQACQVINQMPDLKWVQSTRAGVDPLLIPDIRRDCILTNARNVYGSMMSEFIFEYLLMIERHILTR